LKQVFTRLNGEFEDANRRVSERQTPQVDKLEAQVDVLSAQNDEFSEQVRSLQASVRLLESLLAKMIDERAVEKRNAAETHAGELQELISGHKLVVAEMKSELVTAVKAVNDLL
jgi:uncharacterized coiled-coil DUF342 family protein